MEQDGDITLIELRDALYMAEGVRAHHTSISKALRSLGFIYKNAFDSKVNQTACSQDQSRAEWLKSRQPLMSRLPEKT